MQPRDMNLVGRITERADALRLEQLRSTCRELATELARAKRSLIAAESELRRLRESGPRDVSSV